MPHLHVDAKKKNVSSLYSAPDEFAYIAKESHVLIVGPGAGKIEPGLTVPMDMNLLFLAQYLEARLSFVDLPGKGSLEEKRDIRGIVDMITLLNGESAGLCAIDAYIGNVPDSKAWRHIYSSDDNYGNYLKNNNANDVLIDHMSWRWIIPKMVAKNWWEDLSCISLEKRFSELMLAYCNMVDEGKAIVFFEPKDERMVANSLALLPKDIRLQIYHNVLDYYRIDNPAILRMFGVASAKAFFFPQVYSCSNMLVISKNKDY
ncbi:MAG: hypothetical protein NDI94_03320 [Candidatus Woesearchaeota archaeon]|nr:hypothetical protein [Candidatus Woesearchaeota archaeon]